MPFRSFHVTNSNILLRPPNASIAQTKTVWSVLGMSRLRVCYFFFHFFFFLNSHFNICQVNIYSKLSVSIRNTLTFRSLCVFTFILFSFFRSPSLSFDSFQRLFSLLYFYVFFSSWFTSMQTYGWALVESILLQYLH